MQRFQDPAATRMAAEEISNVNYEVSLDPLRLRVDAVHAYLTRSYWSPGIPLGIVSRAIENSLCAGVYLGSEQVGFARVITDRSTFGYLADVYILEPHRGRGLSKDLVGSLLAHRDLQGLRRLLLLTRDAQGLYARFGFKPEDSNWIMELHRPDAYAKV